MRAAAASWPTEGGPGHAKRSSLPASYVCTVCSRGWWLNRGIPFQREQRWVPESGSRSRRDIRKSEFGVLHALWDTTAVANATAFDVYPYATSSHANAVRTYCELPDAHTLR